MGLDLLLLTLVCVVAGFGAARGALASGLGLTTLLGAYAAGILAGPRLGPELASAARMPAGLGAAFAGALAFAFAYVVLGLLARWLRGIEARRVGLARTHVDRAFGGVFGALRGGLAAVLLAWLALFVEVLHVPGLPPLGDSVAARLTSSAVEAGALAAFGSDPGSRVAARLAARPAETLQELDAVLSDPHVSGLRDDARFWSSVDRGQADAALHRASFVALAGDARLRRRFAALGLVGERAGADPAAFRDEMAHVLEDLAPRLRALREDPELERLMQDPKVVEMARAGDHFALASHPGVRAVVARAMTGSTPRP